MCVVKKYWLKICGRGKSPGHIKLREIYELRGEILPARPFWRQRLFWGGGGL